MDNIRTIIIDINGSDKGPENVILGASLLLAKHENVKLTLVGNKDLINESINKLNMAKDRVKIIDSKEEITNLDNIATAFFNKPNASVLLAIKELSNDKNAIGLLSAGNSGAILMGSVKYLPIQGVRPCVAAVVPSELGGWTCMLDSGANIDTTSSNLHSFAILGRDFMRQLYGIESPKIGLLSNGVEPTKGNKLVKETHHLLVEDKTLNFVGNIEGSRAFSGDCDVLVTDGFAGNQVLKATEGTAKRLITDIVKYSKKNNKPEFMEIAGYLKNKYDLSSLGGAIVLGISKPIIKCHGNSNENSFLNTGEMLLNLAENKTLFEGK